MERARENGRDVAVISLAKRLEEVYVPGRLGPAADPAPTRRHSRRCSGSATRPIASRSTSTARAAAKAMTGSVLDELSAASARCASARC